MFEKALQFTMLYEVGPHFKLDDETRAGLCKTAAQKKKTGYVNDPDDKGGETKFGIAKTANPGINIQQMSWALTVAIYENKYWKAGQCDKMPELVAMAHFDACVNHGVRKANQFLQRALGVKDDGDIGPKTLAALAANPEVLSRLLDVRKTFFFDIVKNNPTQNKFINGWLARVDSLKASLT